MRCAVAAEDERGICSRLLMNETSKAAKCLARILSRDAGPFWQFVKYGAIGVLSTVIQTAVFYLCAVCLFRCLTPDDWAVTALGFPSARFTGGEVWYLSRGMLAAVDTAIGFVIANVFCWVMNRIFVFTPGKFSRCREFLLFFGTSAFTTFLALAVMKALIDCFGMMTTLAVFVEVVVSFLVNFSIRKFYIFKK